MVMVIQEIMSIFPGNSRPCIWNSQVLENLQCSLHTVCLFLCDVNKENITPFWCRLKNILRIWKLVSVPDSWSDCWHSSLYCQGACAHSKPMPTDHCRILHNVCPFLSFHSRQVFFHRYGSVISIKFVLWCWQTRKIFTKEIGVCMIACRTYINVLVLLGLEKWQKTLYVICGFYCYKLTINWVVLTL